MLNTFTSAIQATSADLTYVVSGGLLFRLQSGVYRQIQTLSTFDQYKIKSIQDQVIVYGWSSTSSSNNKFNVRMRLYVATFQSSFTIIDNFNITSTGSLINYIPVMISPSLTKLHYVFYTDTTTSHVFKHISFAGKTVTDIEQRSQNRFL